MGKATFSRGDRRWPGFGWFKVLLFYRGIEYMQPLVIGKHGNNKEMQRKSKQKHRKSKEKHRKRGKVKKKIVKVRKNIGKQHF